MVSEVALIHAIEMADGQAKKARQDPPGHSDLSSLASGQDYWYACQFPERPPGNGIIVYSHTCKPCLMVLEVAAMKSPDKSMKWSNDVGEWSHDIRAGDLLEEIREQYLSMRGMQT